MESGKEKLKKNKPLPFFGVPKLLPFLKVYGKTIIILITLGILSSLADVIFPYFNSYAINNFISKGTLEGIVPFILLYVGLVILQEIDNFYCLYKCGIIEFSIDRDLRNASFNHLQTLSFSYFNQNNVGYVHARVMSDTAKIGELVTWRMMDIIWDLSYIIFVMVSMFLLNPKLAIYVIILVPIATAVIMIIQKKLVFFNRKVREMNSKITGDFNEGITGVKSIKTLTIEEKMDKEFQKDTRKMRNVAIKTAHHSAMLTSLITMLSAFALALVLWRGGIITMKGLMSVGTLSIFMSYAVGMLEPIQHIISALSALISIQVNIERFTNLLKVESDVADTEEVIEKYGDNFVGKKENWEALYGDVEFKDVTFRYPDGDENVLEHFNLKVPQGTNVAIVGETGAGKSTLVNLVCRFYEPTQGQVLIDGVDARERSQLWLHSNIGYVLQSPQLFSGTVRDNLRYGNPEAEDEEIWDALKLISADTVVKKMDKGLDSDIGEGGGRLSTGEKQLLSFTRALLADPRILVLDEATSSIDTVTEKAIQNAIETIIKGRTSFVIAHRLSTIEDADIILAVKGGKIVEMGNHHELMAKKGYYYQLQNKQYEDMVKI